MKGRAHERQGFVVLNEGACARFWCALVNGCIPQWLIRAHVQASRPHRPCRGRVCSLVLSTQQYYINGPSYPDPWRAVLTLAATKAPLRSALSSITASPSFPSHLPLRPLTQLNPPSHHRRRTFIDVSTRPPEPTLPRNLADSLWSREVAHLDSRGTWPILTHLVMPHHRTSRSSCRQGERRPSATPHGLDHARTHQAHEPPVRA